MSRSEGEPNSEVVPHLKLLAAILGVALDLFPALSFYNHSQPPFWPKADVFLALIGILLMRLGYQHGKNRRHHSSTALILVICAVVLWAMYGLFWNWTTASPPREKRQDVAVVQIGFGMWQGGMTDKARNALNRGPAVANNGPPTPESPYDLLQYFRAWGDPSLVWKSWSIICAGYSLVALFLVAFASWSLGLGYALRSI